MHRRHRTHSPQRLEEIVYALLENQRELEHRVAHLELDNRRYKATQRRNSFEYPTTTAFRDPVVNSSSRSTSLQPRSTNGLPFPIRVSTSLHDESSESSHGSISGSDARGSEQFASDDEQLFLEDASIDAIADMLERFVPPPHLHHILKSIRTLMRGAHNRNDSHAFVALPESTEHRGDFQAIFDHSSGDDEQEPERETERSDSDLWDDSDAGPEGREGRFSSEEGSFSEPDTDAESDDSPTQDHPSSKYTHEDTEAHESDEVLSYEGPPSEFTMDPTLLTDGAVTITDLPMDLSIDPALLDSIRQQVASESMLNETSGLIDPPVLADNLVGDPEEGLSPLAHGGMFSRKDVELMMNQQKPDPDDGFSSKS